MGFVAGYVTRLLIKWLQQRGSKPAQVTSFQGVRLFVGRQIYTLYWRIDDLCPRGKPESLRDAALVGKKVSNPRERVLSPDLLTLLAVPHKLLVSFAMAYCTKP